MLCPRNMTSSRVRSFRSMALHTGALYIGPASLIPDSTAFKDMRIESQGMSHMA